MKHIVIVLCALTVMTTDAFAGRKGYSTRGYRTTKSYRSTGGHGINGCGVKYCHGEKCRGLGGTTSTSTATTPATTTSPQKTYDNTLKGIRTANSVVRTVNNTVRTIDYHEKTKKDLEYKDLRNEKLRRELETGRQIARPLIIVHEDPKSISTETHSKTTNPTPTNGGGDVVVDAPATETIKPVRILKKPVNSTTLECPECGYTLHYTRKECPGCGLKVQITE